MGADSGRAEHQIRQALNTPLVVTRGIGLNSRRHEEKTPTKKLEKPSVSRAFL